MIWEHYAKSHWVCKEFSGYVIHARCRPKKNAKTIFDTFKESWVLQTSLNDKKIVEFKNQDYIATAMNKAASYVKACLNLQEQIMKLSSIKIPDGDLRKIRDEWNKQVGSSTVSFKTPIFNSTESNN